MVLVWTKQIKAALTLTPEPAPEVKTQTIVVPQSQSVFSNKNGKRVRPAIPVETVMIVTIPTI